MNRLNGMSTNDRKMLWNIEAGWKNSIGSDEMMGEENIGEIKEV